MNGELEVTENISIKKIKKERGLEILLTPVQLEVYNFKGPFTVASLDDLKGKV